MASGKSLELAKIQRPAPKHICGTCRGVWEDHLRKDGKGLLKKYEGHRPAGHGSNSVFRVPRRGRRSKIKASNAN